ncbi:phage tail tape measure protein [Pseudonocardia sp.]|uniref:phage tail tape measure protein n=1 Tax=Pseudonocardia sp. TaxID=60912 RepID=UPI003D0B20DA
MAAGGIIEIAVVPDMGDFESKLRSGVEGAAGGAEQASKGIGLAIAAAAAIAGAGLADVIAIGNEYQGTLNEIGAVSGASASKMSEVGTRAKELGSDLTLSGVSAADAAAAMLELAKGGLSVDQAMQAAQGTLQLAGAAQIEGARAAEIQVEALNQFGLAAGEAGRVADTLANTANAASGSIEDIALAMKYVGPVASGMKVSIEDTSTAIGLLANSGIKADTAGTSLRGMLVSLASPSKQAAKAITELGIQAFDSQGKFVGFRSVIDQLSAAQARMTDEQFASAAATAFGREPLAAIVALASQGAPAFDAMREAVGKQGGAAQVAASKMQGLGGAMEGFKSNVETAQIQLYELIDGPLESLVRAATRGVDGLNSLLDGSLLKGASGGGIASIVQGAKDAWQDFQSVLENVKRAAEPVASGIRSVMDSLNRNDSVLAAVGRSFGIISDALRLLSGLLVPIGSLIGGLLKGFAALPGPIQTAAFALLALKVGPAILGGLMAALRGVPLVGTPAANAISGVGRGLATVGPNALRAATGITSFAGHMRVQTALAAQAGQSLSRYGAAVAVLESRGSKLAPTLAAMGQSFTRVNSAVSGLAPAVSGAVTSAVASVAKLPQAVQSAATSVRSGVTSAVASIKTLPAQTVSALSSLRTGAASAVSGFVATMKTLPTQTASALSSLRTSVTSAGTTAVASLKAIPSAVTEGFRNLPSTLGTAAGAVTRFTGVVAGAGAAMGTGLARGVSGLLGALGGPWGAALVAAGIAVSIFAGKQRDAAQAAAEHQQKLDNLKGSLNQVTGAATDATRAIQAQELTNTKLKDGTTSLSTAIAKLGIDSKTWVDATTGNQAALESINGTLHTQAVQVLQTSDLWNGGLIQSYKDAGGSIDLLADAAIGNEQAFQKFAEMQGASGDGAKYLRQELEKIVGPIGEVGAQLGASAGGFAEMSKAARDNAAAAATFDNALKLLGENHAFDTLKDGATATAPVIQMLSDLTAAAGKSAQKAGEDSFKATQSIEAGAASARDAMQKSRDAFVEQAAAALGSREAAEALANQIGLIPAAAETTFRTNATGVTAELVTLDAQIGKLPKDKSVTVRSITEEAQAKLESFGFKVEHMKDGTVKITATTDEASGKLDAFLALIGTKVGKILIDANPELANGKVSATVQFANGQTGVVTIDGNKAPVDGKITASVQFANGSTGVVTIDANQTPVNGKITASVQYADGSTGTITLAAKDLVSSVIAKLKQPTSSTHTINVITVGASLPGGKTTGSIKVNATGGIVEAMAHGGIRGKKLRPMSPIAQVVPPNTWRVVGDRLKDDESYIPIDGSHRSLAILEETARRFGYGLTRNFADGGFAQSIRTQVASSLAARFRNTGGSGFTDSQIDRIVSAVTSRGDVLVQQTVHNPIAERASATLTRELRTLSQLGAFGT